MASHSLFKFTKEGVTRRVTLPSNIHWLEIATKLETLYNVPLEMVGVSYVDNDGDEITISTQDELQDYYRARGSPAPDDPIKFTVVDLNTLRATSDKPLPDTPPTAQPLHDESSRNTFGAIPISLDDDWHAIPGFDIFAPSTDSVRFEELASDAGSRLNDNNRRNASVASSESGSTATAKARSSGGDNDTSSIDSVIGNDTPKKPPVHVYNRQSSSRSSVSVSGIKPQGRSIPTPSSPDAVPDPPLPNIEPSLAASPNPSLTSDVAALLNTIATIFSSHPELADGLRSILRNVGNGSYWDTHREQVAHAAEQIRRSTQDLHEQMADTAMYSSAAEEQASRRIAEAIGNIVQSLGQMALGTDDQQAPPDQHRSEPQGGPGGTRPTLWSVFGYPLSPARPPSSSQPSDDPRLPHLPPHPAPPPHPPHPPHLYRPPRGQPPHPQRPRHPPFPFGGWGSRMGPPPPPPPHDPNAPWPFSHSSWSMFGPSPSPSHPPRPPHGNNASHSDISDDDNSEVEDAEISMYGVSPMSLPQVRRSKVLAARAAYKAEKEKYRQEKQTRRMVREKLRNPEGNVDARGTARPATTSSPVAGPSGSGDGIQVTQLISHGRGQFPPLEHFSIPRSQTVHGPGRTRHRRETSATATTDTSRARITRRLSDMGFNDPSVERRVSIHVPDDVIREKSNEDNIVSSVVEELLNDMSRTDGAPGSSHD